MMPAAGVKFTMYDEYGLPKNDGFDYQQFIRTDEMQPSDMYIPAPPEMIERMMVRTGYHKDVDKEFKDMTEEGTYLFFIHLQKRQYSSAWKTQLASMKNWKMISSFRLTRANQHSLKLKLLNKNILRLNTQTKAQLL